MVSQITFGGLASGLDTNSIIAALVAVEKTPIALMQNNKAGIENKISEFAKFKSHLETLQSAAEALKDEDSFNVFSTAVSAEGYLSSISANKNALAGNYDIKITDLATNEQEASANVSDKTAELFGTGILTINLGGTDHDIIIEEGQNTLEGIAAAINADEDLDVTASVINDGSGTPYRLVLSGDDSGEDNTITIDESGLAGGTNTLSFTQLQAASDAHFTINNIDMQSATNEVSNALNGISFTLTNATPLNENVSLTIEKDIEALKTKFTEFVDAYNAVATFINNNNTYSTVTEKGGVLMGESLLTQVQSKLQNALIKDWDPAKGDFQLMSQVGINFTNTGGLEIDATELETALTENFAEVVEIFSDSGIADDIDTALEDYTKFAGTLDNKKKSLESISKDLDKQILKAEDRLDLFEQNLVMKYSALEQLMGSLTSQQYYMSTVQLPSYG